MISTGDRCELELSGVKVRRERVWGSGIRTCADYWIGLEKVGIVVLRGFSHIKDDPFMAVLNGGCVVFESSLDVPLEETMIFFEEKLSRCISTLKYDSNSLKNFQSSKFFNRGEMPVSFEMEK